jgi:hypothetical protein
MFFLSIQRIVFNYIIIFKQFDSIKKNYKTSINLACCEALLSSSSPTSDTKVKSSLSKIVSDQNKILSNINFAASGCVLAKHYKKYIIM